MLIAPPMVLRPNRVPWGPSPRPDLRRRQILACADRLFQADFIDADPDAGVEIHCEFALSDAAMDRSLSTPVLFPGIWANAQ